MKHHVYFPPGGEETFHCEACPCFKEPRKNMTPELAKKMRCVIADDESDDWAECRVVSGARFFFYTLSGIGEEREL